MKNRRVTKFIALIVGVGLITGVGSVSRAGTSLPAPSLTVSKYGTLLEILDANGKSRFGKLTGEGFQLSYEFKGKTISVGAVGDAEAVGLTAGDVKTTEGKSTIVTTTTSDHALEITTYFFVNKQTNRLSIQRQLKNISKEPVVVKTLLEYVDPALVIGTGQKLKNIDEKSVAVLREKLGLAIVPLGADCQPDCPPDPPACPECPAPTKIKFDLARMTVRANPEGDRSVSLILPADTTALTLEPAGNINDQAFAAIHMGI